MAKQGGTEELSSHFAFNLDKLSEHLPAAAVSPSEDHWIEPEDPDP